MTRTRLLGAIGVSIWSAITAGSQPASTAALSDALRAHLKSERYEIVTSVRGLPLGVREALQTLFGSRSLDIADPGAGDVDGTPPVRRLVAAGCSIDHHCLVYYERGGGAARTWRVALFQWSPTATRLEWGGQAPGGLKTIEDVRKGILSGAFKGETELW
jgi:hypothetical protein